jgi:hypothetical protein
MTSIPWYQLRQTLKFTILTFATTHLTIDYLTALFAGQTDNANVFNIIDVNLLFPTLGTGTAAFWWSQLMAVAVFVSIFVWRQTFRRTKSRDQG